MKSHKFTKHRQNNYTNWIVWLIKNYAEIISYVPSDDRPQLRCKRVFYRPEFISSLHLRAKLQITIQLAYIQSRHRPHHRPRPSLSILHSLCVCQFYGPLDPISSTSFFHYSFLFPCLLVSDFAFFSHVSWYTFQERNLQNKKLSTIRTFVGLCSHWMTHKQQLGL